MKSQANRLSLVSLPEAQEVYSVPQFTAQERQYFFTFTDDELSVVKGLHSHRNRVHFLLMLGYFKAKRVCLTYSWKDVEVDYQYISQRYYSSANKQKQNIDRFTRSRLYKRVLDFTGYQRCDKKTEAKLLSQLERRIKFYIDPAQLFLDAITFLKSNNIAIPRYSTLQKLISKTISAEEARMSKLISKHLCNSELFMRLIDKDRKSIGLNNLKKLNKANKFGENNKEMIRHQELSGLFNEALRVVGKIKISEGNIRYFASCCHKYDIYDLRELNKNTTLIYLICFVVARFRISNDALTLSFLSAYKVVDGEANIYRDEQFNTQSIEMAEYIDQVPLVLNLFIDNHIHNNINFGSVRSSAFEILSKEKIFLVIQKMEKVTMDKNIFKWEFIDKNFRKIIMNIRPLFMRLEFGCRDNAVLEKQIASTKEALASKQSAPSMDGRLIMKNDKRHLKLDPNVDQEDDKRITNRSELYLYKLLYRGLRNGSIYIKNSLEYKSFDEYLVDDKIWDNRRKHLSDIGLDWMIDSKDDHIKSLENIFNEKILAVSHRIEEGNNDYIKLKPNTDKLLWSRAVISKDSELTERFFANFFQKSIVNAIRKVNEDTGFMTHLKSQSTRHKKSSASVESILACLIANGTFQGTHKFSVLSDQQPTVLNRIEDECFHDESIQQALDTITGSATRLSIFDDFRLDDGEIHSSADGQRFESKHGNPLVGHSSKHFGKKRGGISYTMSSSHFVQRGKLIPAKSHESHHLFDLAYNNTSDLKATVISTDTHGTNQFNHAILNTFGYQFTPRYAKFKRKFLSEFNVSPKGGMSLSLTKPINWKLIRKEWDNIVKIMLSLGLRTVQQSTLVEKLCSFEQNNATMMALAEYNRVFKCLHLLEYADDKQLRQVIQESLNRGEQLQGLKRALAALGGNQFRGKSPEEMARWNGCADLLANCIVYYNAWIMSSFKSYCLTTGKGSQLKHLRSISPASWEHIILNGSYDLAENDEHWDIDAEIKGLVLAA